LCVPDDEISGGGIGEHESSTFAIRYMGNIETSSNRNHKTQEALLEATPEEHSLEKSLTHDVTEKQAN
jgi:hypothetical protein